MTSRLRMAPAPLLVLWFALALVTSAPASAHTDLAGSSPSAGARLTKAPTSLALTFTDDIAPEFARVSLTRGPGEAQRLEVSVSGPRVNARVPQLDRSGRITWAVAYRVVSADGHPVSGTFSFIAPAGAAPRPTGSSSPAERAGRQRTANTAAAAGASERDDAGGGVAWAAIGVAVLVTVPLAGLVILVLRRRSSADNS